MTNRLNKKIIIGIAGVLAILLIAFVINQRFNGNKVKPNVLSQATINQNSQKQSVTKDFSFPLKDSKDKELGRFKYQIESAELNKQIVVKGKVMSAVEGKTFLILNLKLSNELDKRIQLNTRDFVRVALQNNEGEWLAAELHNDPVEVQAISTKNARLGFPVSAEVKAFKVQVGEINGEKTVFDLQF